MTGVTERRQPVRQRADAVRKRAAILAAARIVFVERGAEVPMDEIARRAEVGNATLYRHFPDRASLIREVVREVFRETLAATEAAIREEPTALAALVRYMHAALDIGIAAVMPALAGPARDERDDELEHDRVRSVTLLEGLIRDAKAEGALRPEVAFSDIGLMLIRLSRPLPGRFSAEMNHAISHRQLAIYIDGLLTGTNDRSSLTGPRLEQRDLSAMNRSRADQTDPADRTDDQTG